MAEDKHSKKHPASDHKKRNLKKKGTVAKSQDVPMALGLLAAFGVMVSLRNFYLAHFHGVMRRCIESIEDPDLLEQELVPLLLFVVKEIATMSLPILVAVLLAGIIGHMAQSGLIITGEQLKPDIKKINPMTKLKQWFSVKSLQELGKSLAKILAAGLIGYLAWKGSLEAINGSVFLNERELISLCATIIRKMFLQILILYLVVALFDYGFQKKNFATEHKMTDKEVKDEYKQMEGDPYMKAKRRQVAMQIAFQQSQEHVPDSDVVVINPTELAIALKYDPDVSPVPFVLSKGEKRHADDIRESARNAGVPVVRNKPLARALHEMCEIGDIVPEDLYRPVAEVLAYVLALREQAAIEAIEAQQSATQQATDAILPGVLADDLAAIHDLGDIAVPVMAGDGALTADPAGMPMATGAGAQAPEVGIPAPGAGNWILAQPELAPYPSPGLEPYSSQQPVAHSPVDFADHPVYGSAWASYPGGETSWTAGAHPTGAADSLTGTPATDPATQNDGWIPN